MQPVARALAAAALLFATAPAPAQARAAVPAGGVDPYTRGDAALMAKAGYVSFGPFPFGHRCTSDEVGALLVDEQLLWVETAHFRIGCSLPDLPLSGDKDREQMAKLGEELQRLALRLPGIRGKTAGLDPWLRLHLTAQRAEDVYRDVQQVLGCSDADFPAAPGDDPRQPSTYRGRGPFLGNPEKFTVLLVQRSVSLQRFTAAYHGLGTSRATVHHDHEFGSAFVGLAVESDGGRLRHDLALRKQLTFHVAQNLYNSFRSYRHNLPAWLINGLCQHHARRVTTRFPVFDLRSTADPDGKQYATWDKRATLLMRERRFEPLGTFCLRMDVHGFHLDDHLQSFALVGWLLAEHPTGLREFLQRMKDPFPDLHRFPTPEELAARQHQAMLHCFGCDAAQLDERWRSGQPMLNRR